MPNETTWFIKSQQQQKHDDDDVCQSVDQCFKCVGEWVVIVTSSVEGHTKQSNNATKEQKVLRGVRPPRGRGIHSLFKVKEHTGARCVRSQ